MAKKKVVRPSRLLNSMPSSNAHEQSQSPEAPASDFLSLPPEIRTRIYDYAMGGNEIHVDCRYVPDRYSIWYTRRVTHDELVELYRRDAEAGGLSLRTCRFLTESNLSIATSRKEGNEPDMCFALLQTCRQVHWKAALIPFHSNRFVLDVSEPAHYRFFLDRLMPAQRAAIRSLRLIFNDSYHALTKDFALSMPKVTKLAISMPGDVNHYDIRTKSQWEMVCNLQIWPLKMVSVIACPGEHISKSEVRPPRSDGEIRELAALAKEIERKLLLTWDEDAFRRGLKVKREARANREGQVADARMEERKEVVKSRGLRPRK